MAARNVVSHRNGHFEFSSNFRKRYANSSGVGAIRHSPATPDAGLPAGRRRAGTRSIRDVTVQKKVKWN
jgi:hypothetical protein